MQYIFNEIVGHLGISGGLGEEKLTSWVILMFAPIIIC